MTTTRKYKTIAQVYDLRNVKEMTMTEIIQRVEQMKTWPRYQSAEFFIDGETTAIMAGWTA